MPCFFSVIGQVASVSTGTGRSHNAVVLFQEGPLGGPGDDRYFEVDFTLAKRPCAVDPKHLLANAERGFLRLCLLQPTRRKAV